MLVNDCQQCHDHDERTKQLMAELFGVEERMMLALLLSNSIVNRDQSRKRVLPGQNGEIEKLKAQRDIDFAAAVLGKFDLGFDDVNRAKLKKLMIKVGLKMNITHEACPHREKEGNDANVRG